MLKAITSLLSLTMFMLNGCSAIGVQSHRAAGAEVETVTIPVANNPVLSSTSDDLVKTITTLDAQVFDTFNHCDQPEMLIAHGRYFAEDVEFYHDTGGVTWTRDEMIESTKNYVCGKFRRELVTESLHVYPIKDFGAIEQGEHLFCKKDAAQCEGRASFVIIWRNRDNTWEITRVLSFGHRENN